MAGSLDDVRVIEVAEGWGGPMCAKLLAELGAEVIKVEPPRGDWLRSYGPMKNGVSYAFQLTSAQKKSVVLDIADPNQQGKLHDLIQTADVLIENFPVGALASYGLDYPSIERLNPELIYCSITPYGQRGPLSNWVGNELTAQAIAGIMATTGFPDGPATRAGVGLAELVGAIYAAIGILAALHYRDRTSVGQAVDIALCDCLISYLSHFVANYVGNGRLLPRCGNRHPTSYPWAVFPAKDGLVTIASHRNVRFPQFCKLMGREDVVGLPQFANPDLRRENADELDEIISEWTRTKTVQEIVQELVAHHIPAGPIPAIDQVLANEQFLARGMLVKVDHPTAGEMFTSGPLCKLSETPGVISQPAPLLGQHTDEVLGSIKARSKPAMARASADPDSQAGRPLEGIRIADLSHATAGEWCGRILANLGAEAINVEPLEGGIERHQGPRFKGIALGHVYNCADKKSITCEIGTAEGKEIVGDLVRVADIVVENFAPRTVVSLGFDYESLREINPRIIYGSVKGFGLTGPYRDRPAFDSVIQGMAGVVSLTGWPDGTPFKVGISLSDVLAGTTAVLPILAALHYRNRTGVGQLADLAMYDASSWLTQQAWPHYFATGKAPPRYGNAHPVFVPYNAYQAKDDMVAIAVETDQQWYGLLQAMGGNDLLSDPRYATIEGRQARREEIGRLVAEWTKTLTADQVAEVCQRFHVPAAPVLNIDRIVEHSHILYREMIAEREHPEVGPIPVTGTPLKLSKTPGRVDRASATVGQHNEEIYTGLLGYSKERLAQLRAKRVVS